MTKGSVNKKIASKVSANKSKSATPKAAVNKSKSVTPKSSSTNKVITKKHVGAAKKINRTVKKTA